MLVDRAKTIFIKIKQYFSNIIAKKTKDNTENNTQELPQVFNEIKIEGNTQQQEDIVNNNAKDDIDNTQFIDTQSKKDIDDDTIEIEEDKNKKEITEQDIMDNILSFFDISNIKKDIDKITRQKQTQENIGKMETLHYKLVLLQEKQEITNFLNGLENNINNLIDELLEATK